MLLRWILRNIRPLTLDLFQYLNWDGNVAKHENSSVSCVQAAAGPHKDSLSKREHIIMKHGASSFIAYAIWNQFGVRLSHWSKHYGQCPLRPLHPVASSSITDCQTGSRPLSEPLPPPPFFFVLKLKPKPQWIECVYLLLPGRGKPPWPNLHGKSPRSP